MIYPYDVKFNGKWYKAGVEVGEPAPAPVVAKKDKAEDNTEKPVEKTTRKKK